ncbi:hypothetical protein SAMN05421505_16220 [Sinosporangium album]|uniref:Uncharacterized protein n=1 Tax=Sinosporangium album TaxID=504805 RepID=A0A1G8L770_9ACTN|nr:hypothetical protein [Sinosporangium album]SDI51528.1 hypothetical protein SAMN05421505_16220 [Sinosporangium album]
MPAQREPGAVARYARTAGVVAGGVAVPVGAWLAHPALGAALAVVEIGLVAAVVLSALWGSAHVSERAFRLMRLALGRAEPKAPPVPLEKADSAAGA